MSDSWQDRDFSLGSLEANAGIEEQTRKSRFVRKIYQEETGTYVGETGLVGLIFLLLISTVAIILFVMGIVFFVTFEGEEAYITLTVSWGFGFGLGFIGHYGLRVYFTGKIPKRYDSTASGSGGGGSHLWNSDAYTDRDDYLQGSDLPDGF
jgi:hypothetical protein